MSPQLYLFSLFLQHPALLTLYFHWLTSGLTVLHPQKIRLYYFVLYPLQKALHWAKNKLEKFFLDNNKGGTLFANLKTVL